jgi:apolipoprotein N-acyltransferase
MDPNLIPNILAGSLFSVALFIAIRAFYIYYQSHSPRIFILALSMMLIALTALDNFIVNIITVPFNTYWFLYIGQIVGYLFILLSFCWSADEALRKLMRWHILFTCLLIVVWIASPLLPSFPNVVIRAALSGIRAALCFCIFFFYVLNFMKKESRFTLLMSIAFILLTVGQWLVFQKYFVPDGQIIDNVGDITRLVGQTVLLIAVIIG